MLLKVLLGTSFRGWTTVTQPGLLGVLELNMAALLAHLVPAIPFDVLDDFSTIHVYIIHMS